MIPTYSSSLFTRPFIGQPPAKRLKKSTEIEIDKPCRKRPLPESFGSDFTSPPLKDRKVIPSPAVKDNLPPIQSIYNQSLPSMDPRYIPKRLGIGSVCLSQESFNTDQLTPHQQYLSSSLFGSRQPKDERVLHFSDRASKPRHPYELSMDSDVQHPKCIAIKEPEEALYLKDDFYDQALAYNSENNCFACILDGTVHLDKGRHDYIFSPYNENWNSHPTAIAFSPDGESILISMKDGSLFGYNLEFEPQGISARKVCEINALCLGVGRQKHQLVVSDSWIFVGMQNGRICRINKSNFDEIDYYKNTDYAPITGLALSPDGQSLLASNNDGTIYLFDIEKDEPLSVLKEIKSAVKALAFSPCGNYFVAGGGEADPRVILFEIQDEKIGVHTSYNPQSQVTALFWHNNFVLSTHRDGQIRTFPILPNSPSIMSPPKTHETPQLGHRLTFAVLKCNHRDRDILTIGSNQYIFDMEIKSPHPGALPRKSTRSTQYDTIH